MKRLEREPGAPHLTFRVLALAQKQVAPGSGIPEVAASGIFTSGHLALRELTLPTYKLKKVGQTERRTKMNQTQDEGFSELRSLMQNEKLTEEQRSQLWLLVRKLAKQAPDYFREVHLPYLSGFPHHFAAPLARMSHFKGFEKACSILPCARFALRLANSSRPPKQLLERLAKSPYRRCLGELDMSRVHLGDDGARTLAKLLPEGLKQLSLWDSGLHSSGLHALLECRALESVEHLDLGGNHFGAQEIEAISQSPRLKGLKELILNWLGCRDHGALALATSPYLTNLKVLSLSEADIGSEGLEALANSPNLASIRSLYLHMNYIDDVGVSALAQSPQLRSLRLLWLYYNPITSVGIQALASSPHAVGLEVLQVDTDEVGQAHIRNSPYLRTRVKASFA